MACRTPTGRREDSTTMTKLPSIARICTAVLLMAAPVAADEPASSPPGIARSMSFLALAPNVAVTVRPLDNSRANLVLKQHFATALKKRAMLVDEAASAYVLNFETEIDQAPRRGDSSIGSASGSNRESDVRINVWATHRDSMLRGRAGETGDRGMLRYTLTATLDDERSGRRLWQGEASYSGAPGDEATTMATMATILTEQLGQTVRQKTFRIE
jgi:hypothetical protein